MLHLHIYILLKAVLRLIICTNNDTVEIPRRHFWDSGGILKWKPGPRPKNPLWVGIVLLKSEVWPCNMHIIIIPIPFGHNVTNICICWYYIFHLIVSLFEYKPCQYNYTITKSGCYYSCTTIVMNKPFCKLIWFCCID